MLFEKNAGTSGMHVPWVLLYLCVPLCWADNLSGVWPGRTLTTVASDINTTDVQYNGCTCRGSQTVQCSGSVTCFRFPVGMYPGITNLKVISTAIVTLEVGTFLSLNHLIELSLLDNSHLRHIKPGTFNGLDSLQTLFIRQNPRLTSLLPDTFQGLHNLKDLSLEDNGFSTIADITPTLAPAFLPRLQTLSLENNNLQPIMQHDFAPMNGTTLENLNMINCYLEHIHPEAFRPLQYLRFLYLGQNALESTILENIVIEFPKYNTYLEYLNLFSMSFTGQLPKTLLTAIGITNITHLVLSGNSFPELKAGSFPKMPNLITLEIENCDITSIEPGTFTETLMPNLLSLHLAQNMLTNVSSGVRLPQLSILDLSDNTWHTVSTSYFDLGEGNFINMTSLMNLSLAFNRLYTIRTGAFAGLENLSEMLYLQNASISQIEPGAFSELKNLSFLNLEMNSFPIITGLTADIFQGLDSLQVLLLGGCGITNISDPNVFSPLTELRYLSLDRNNIITLNPNIFLPLINLIGFDISLNLLEPWTQERLFQNNPNMSMLLMPSNQITYLSRVMLEDLSVLTSVVLNDNPFICDCSFFFETQNWLNLNNFTLLKIIKPQTNPKCYSPDSWKHKYITEFLALTDNESCEETIANESYIWVAVTCVLLILLIVGLGISGYLYRSYIRYWMFLVQMDLRRKGMSRNKGHKKRFCKGYTNYQYDAFVSYSSEDRNFVVRLVAMLENYEPFLKLCVYERDFEVGQAISEAVLESVAASRRTLLVVSDAFARSQWCMWEMQLAEHQRLFFRDDNHDPLVMVKLGEVATCHVTPTLRYLLRTRVHLQWDSESKKQRLFWEKLRATLAPPNLAIKTTTQ